MCLGEIIIVCNGGMEIRTSSLISHSVVYINQIYEIVIAAAFQLWLIDSYCKNMPSEVILNMFRELTERSVS